MVMLTDKGACEYNQPSARYDNFKVKKDAGTGISICHNKWQPNAKTQKK